MLINHFLKSPNGFLYAYQVDLQIMEWIKKGEPTLFNSPGKIPVLGMHIEDYKKYRYQTEPNFSKLQFHIDRIKNI